jgi:uncharacterized SAM-binding protein YcdF (DUF218 family)
VFVLVSKLMAPLVYPLSLGLGLWLAALVCAWRGRRTWGWGCGAAGTGVLLLFSSPWVGEAMLRSLENDYPSLAPADCDSAQAIVVLGGVTAPAVLPRSGVEVNEGFDRLLHGMRLWRAGKAPLLVLCGGVITFLSGDVDDEASCLRQLAVEYGVPPGAMLLEQRSRNTYENAVFVRPLLEQRGVRHILLVTSAAHMRRSVAAFERQGLEVSPAPTDVQVVPVPFSPLRVLPATEALGFSQQAVKEYVGLAVYWLRGWIR